MKYEIEEIIVDILKGDKDKYKILMDYYYKEIFKYIYNSVGDNVTTEDLVHEIFVKVYENINKFNPSKASFRTWLYRISSNNLMNYFKSKEYRQKQENVLLEVEISSNEEDILEKLIKQEKLDLIISIMNRLLKEKHLQIMNLHFFSGLSVKEINETMNIPEKTVYKAIHTSIEKIKKEVLLNERI